METTDPGRYPPRPTAGATAHVEANGVCWQLMPWKDGEIPFKNGTRLGVRQLGLVKARPLIAKAVDGLFVSVLDHLRYLATIHSLPSTASRGNTYFTS